VHGRWINGMALKSEPEDFAAQRPFLTVAVRLHRTSLSVMKDFFDPPLPLPGAAALRPEPSPSRYNE
jgi:hypothetical protein